MTESEIQAALADLKARSRAAWEEYLRLLQEITKLATRLDAVKAIANDPDGYF